MRISKVKITEWLLRVALSAELLSAVADRFGLWKKEVSVWGNWDRFVVYTKQLLPFIPLKIIPFIAGAAILLEIALGIGLLINYKTSLVAKVCGYLLLSFAFAMTYSAGIKAPLDYSVFAAAAAAFALSTIVRMNKGKRR